MPTKIADLPLDGRSVEEILAAAKEASETTQKKPNILVFGDGATGKSTLATTCPGPVYMLVFDSCTTNNRYLKQAAKEGKLIMETFYDKENPWVDFIQRFNYLKDMKVFASVGTCFVDSFTTMAECALDYVLGARKGTTPQQKDYMEQQIAINGWLVDFLALPCLCVLTGHIKRDKDDVTGELVVTLAATGKLANGVPLRFDEVWISQVEGATGKNPNYYLLTAPEMRYKARTSIGSGIFKTREEPDVSALLKKAGLK